MNLMNKRTSYDHERLGPRIVNSQHLDLNNSQMNLRQNHEENNQRTEMKPAVQRNSAYQQSELVEFEGNSTNAQVKNLYEQEIFTTSNRRK